MSNTAEVDLVSTNKIKDVEAFDRLPSILQNVIRECTVEISAMDVEDYYLYEFGGNIAHTLKWLKDEVVGLFNTHLSQDPYYPRPTREVMLTGPKRVDRKKIRLAKYGN